MENVKYRGMAAKTDEKSAEEKAQFWKWQPIKVVPKVNRQSTEVKKELEKRTNDPRVQQELTEMKEKHDLGEIDDDVEAAATLYEWQAPEHVHQPKTPLWFAGMAAGTTLLVGIQLFMLNFLGAISLGAIGAAIYYIAQSKPRVMRYRIMIDGIAINDLLYHWQDLEKFNVIYEPGETKTVLFVSKRRFSPHIHMEIGEADPVEIREKLLEYLREDQDMDEPIADILARRIGF